MLLEKVFIDNDGNVSIDLKTDDDALLPTKISSYNKKISTKNGYPYFIGYRFPNTVPKSQREVIQAAFKTLSLGSNNITLLINKSLLNLTKIANLSEFDVVITPKSSSNLLKLMVSVIKRKMPPSTLVISDQFVKLNYADIKLYNNLLDRLDPDVKEDIIKNLEMTLSKDDWKMKKVYTRYRKFIDQFLALKNPQIISKLVGKRILIVDDILTEGTTLTAMTKLLAPVAKSTMGFVLLAKQ